MKKILSIVALLSIVSADNVVAQNASINANQVEIAKLTPAERGHARRICPILNRHVGEQFPRLTPAELKKVKQHLGEINSDTPKARNFVRTSQLHKTSKEGLSAAIRELHCQVAIHPVYSK